MRTEQIVDLPRIDGGEGLLAVLIFRGDAPLRHGAQFFTSTELPQQVAQMAYPAGHVIEPHTHVVVQRTVRFTQEVLVIQKGSVRIDFYTSRGEYICESRVLHAGDMAVLIGGGHGLEVLEDLEMVEVKQGPYLGDSDKVRFTKESVDGRARHP